MADHPDMTDAELATAVQVYLDTGSYTAAARAIGRSINGVRDALRRIAADADRRKIYARTLDAALAEAVDAQRVAVRKLRPDLSNQKLRADAAFALNDTTAKLVAARTALAKLTGEHAPEKLQHLVEVRKMTDAELDAELDRLARSGGQGAPADPSAREGATAGGEISGGQEDPVGGSEG